MSYINQSICLAPIIVGVMNWGKHGKEMSTQSMAKLIEACHEKGLTSYDHASIYGGYTMEAAFGEALAQTSVKREEIQLLTKCGIQYPFLDSPYSVKHYDYSGAEIIKSAENSLKKLKTDYLDILLLHRPSPLLRVEEIYEAFQSLFSQGKVLSFGVSNFNASTIDLLRQEVPIAYNQIEFSLTQHQALTNGNMDYLQLHRIRPMAWKPLGSIFQENQENKPLSQCLQRLKEQYNVDIDALLIAWIRKHPAEIIPVVGSTQINRLKSQKKGMTIDLALEDWFMLYEASLGHRVP
ncbi:MAG: aldo/keto reductase [Chitinophagales bacterium]|jgi:predicted oxidoreductase|nr:aldo/keto reductase [Chitinophagales bacterium]